MASINYVPGVGFVMDVPGTDRQVVMGSPEEQAMSQSFQDTHNAFMDSLIFKQGRDYTGTFDKLFGAQPRSMNYSPVFGSGPQDRWQGALADRLKMRREGKFDDVGYYERYAQYSDKDWLRNMFERNNAIEEMYRRGYDMGQINAYLSGEQNVLEEGPSWSDYYREQALAKEQGNDPDWTKSYFIGAPDVSQAEYVGRNLSSKLSSYFDNLTKRFEELGLSMPQQQQTSTAERPTTRGLFGKYINKGQEQ